MHACVLHLLLYISHTQNNAKQLNDSGTTSTNYNEKPLFNFIPTEKTPNNCEPLYNICFYDPWEEEKKCNKNENENENESDRDGYYKTGMKSDENETEMEMVGDNGNGNVEQPIYGTNNSSQPLQHHLQFHNDVVENNRNIELQTDNFQSVNTNSPLPKPLVSSVSHNTHKIISHVVQTCSKVYHQIPSNLVSSTVQHPYNDYITEEELINQNQSIISETTDIHVADTQVSTVFVLHFCMFLYIFQCFFCIYLT